MNPPVGRAYCYVHCAGVYSMTRRPLLELVSSQSLADTDTPIRAAVATAAPPAPPPDESIA